MSFTLPSLGIMNARNVAYLVKRNNSVKFQNTLVLKLPKIHIYYLGNINGFDRDIP